MEHMPAQQVMGPTSVHGTLSLTARCNDVQCCSHGTFIIVVSNNDLGKKLNPNCFVEQAYFRIGKHKGLPTD
jgi:hypothetical protein